MLPPDEISSFMYDPTTPFIYKREELFGENTVITPRNMIKRKPDGTLGSC